MMKTFFAPQLYIPNEVTDISFYQRAFGAIVLKRLENENKTIHVAEMSIDGSIFHLHEEKTPAGRCSPSTLKATTAIIGLFVPNVDAAMDAALKAGATLISPAQTYDYGYRQGEIRDPFGHLWLIEAKV